jgi:RNA polymerase sigma-70 factor (ECF subfamily)
MTHSITPANADIFDVTVATSGAQAHGLSLQDQRRLGQQLCLIYRGVADNPVPEAIRLTAERLELAVAKARCADVEFRRDLVGAAPNLRAFAISLTHNSDRAADLVQDTLLRGWAKRRYFQPGTNLHAWLFTILRNAFFSEHRKRSREVQDTGQSYAARLTTAPAQADHLHLQDLQVALGRLSADQREALLLITAEGLSYAQAAVVCECAVGTVKSRVNRGRVRLAGLLSYTEGDLAADNIMQAALARSRS